MLKSKRFNTAATIILTVLVIITLLPLALIVISSFTKESALIRNGYSFWPQEWSLDACRTEEAGGLHIPTRFAGYSTHSADVGQL